MFEFKRRTLSIGLGLVMMTILALGSASIAFADGPIVTVNLGTGSLVEVSGAVTFTAPVTLLTGADQVAIYDFPITVTDSSGSAAGWKLTITSGTFTGTTTATLSPSASTITAVSINATGTNTGTAPVASTTTPVTYPMGLPGASGAAVRFFSAQAGTGMGTSTITPTIHIAIPADTLADSYSSTLVVAIISAP